MTAEQRTKICKRMLWIIPGLILAIIGDYCMGIEPKDSTSISSMISSGWLTIADWRIALSNIGGLIGTVFYAIAALSFIEYLKCKLSQCSDKWDRRFLKLYKGILPLKKNWVLTAPLLIAGIGFLLEMILPLPFNGFASGFESLGWIVMFLGGIRAIKNDEMEAYM